MIEEIKTNVTISGNKESELTFAHDISADVVNVYLRGRQICELPWSENLKPMINRMLEIWK